MHTKTKHFSLFLMHQMIKQKIRPSESHCTLVYNYLYKDPSRGRESSRISGFDAGFRNMLRSPAQRQPQRPRGDEMAMSKSRRTASLEGGFGAEMMRRRPMKTPYVLGARWPTRHWHATTSRAHHPRHWAVCLSSRPRHVNKLWVLITLLVRRTRALIRASYIDVFISMSCVISFMPDNLINIQIYHIVIKA